MDDFIRLNQEWISAYFKIEVVGNQLIELCVQKAQAIEAGTVYLISNTNLEPALSLYKKHGFKIASTAQHPVYSRANIMMELGLL